MLFFFALFESLSLDAYDGLTTSLDTSVEFLHEISFTTTFSLNLTFPFCEFIIAVLYPSPMSDSLLPLPLFM